MLNLGREDQVLDQDRQSKLQDLLERKKKHAK